MLWIFNIFLFRSFLTTLASFCVSILGLYAAAYDLGIEWCIIKAVSNLADGSKEMTDEWQRFATVMAASVVYNMFKHPAVLKDWPRCKDTEVEGNCSFWPEWNWNYLI